MGKTTSLFDIIGPVIIGPSSSHTAGAVKIGLLAYKLAEKEIKNVKFVLYNSFAKTGKGHGTDKGLLAGIMGLNVNDDNIIDAFKIADEKNINYTFDYKDDFSRHPNSVDIIISAENLVIKGDSLGGGEVSISKINDYDVDIRGDYNTLMLIYKDKPGMVFKVSELIKEAKVNIATLACNRTNKGEEASMCITLDSDLAKRTIDKLQNIDELFFIRYIEALKYD
ncbi:MAG: L-serine ammonia-lyase, iron-sulfur-dependent subunit beta [Candidatus Gastranaerophilales bacterium]|nr:L-serine ammonia-lyase, iron-sulfur-dependent subunit beta [Candidatus Gastranaerophilales bacterium]